MSYAPNSRGRAAPALPASLPALRSYEYWLIVYRRIFRGTIASSILNPVLYLTAMGVGLGKVVNHGAHPLPVPYLDFVAPGLLAAVAMQVATIESSFPVRSGVLWSKSYYAMLATPLRIGDMLLGHLLYVATRSASVTGVYLLIITMFGVVHSALALLAVPIGVLLGLSLAGFVSALAITAEQDPFNPLFRFGIMPMFLFSGTFFPVTRLPHGLREVAYATPLWNAVDFVRGCTLGTLTLSRALVHVVYFAAVIAAGVYVAHRAYRKKLIE
jgi:lipooligosaccharide transport system permease protein